MYKEKEMDKLIESGKEKIKSLEKDFKKYLVSSILAGLFVGIGVIFSSSISTYLKGTVLEKIGFGVVFPIALSLVVVLKVELFTSGNFVLCVSYIKKEIRLEKVLKALVTCYLGNWIGAILLTFLFIGTGSLDKSVGEYIMNLAFSKVNYSWIELLFKGILCNILVCLASWTTYKLNSESAKLIMIFWCLFAMVICGFEHSIANMTTLTFGLLKGSFFEFGITGYFYNLFWVTLGNILGGAIFVAIPYYFMHRNEK